MQLTFSCPGCGTDHDLPWSMAGKRASCQRCSNEFRVPVPYEPRPPKSSVAIPVHKADEPPRSAEALPVTQIDDPRRSAEAIPVTQVDDPRRSAEALPVTRADAPRRAASRRAASRRSAEPIPVDRVVEPPRTSTVPPTLRIEALTPGVLAGLREAAPPEPVAPPPRARSRRRDPGSDRAAFVPEPVEPARPARRPRPPEPEIPPAPEMAPMDVSSLISAYRAKASPLISAYRGKASSLISAYRGKASSLISAHWPRARPDWLIPALAGGGLALLVVMNIAFYVMYFGGRGTAPVEPAAAKPAEVAIRVEPIPIQEPPAEPPPVAEADPPRDVTPPEPAPPRRPLRGAVPAGVMSTREIVEKYEASVALIRGRKGSGTGFVARSGIVATNSHVIEGERLKDVEVRFPSAPQGRQGPHPVRLLYQDKDRDLALLGVASDLAPVPVAEDYRFRKGEDVTVIGNPGVGGQMVLENAICRGIVSTMTKLKDHTFLQLGIAINPGNSGGPVFDPRGRVIGVVTLKTVKQEGLAFAVPAADLLSALQAAESAALADPGALKSSAPGNRLDGER